MEKNVIEPKEAQEPSGNSPNSAPSSGDELGDLGHLLSHLNSDETANIILKGHLVIEERLTTAIEDFTFHAEHLEDARLTFAQKLSICRSISLDLDDSPIWDVLGKLNRLRNALAHSLDIERRSTATESLIAAYAKVCGGQVPTHEGSTETLMFTCVLAMCLGFLSTVVGKIREVQGSRFIAGQDGNVSCEVRVPRPSDQCDNGGNGGHADHLSTSG
jgi:hypothetical protein